MRLHGGVEGCEPAKGGRPWNDGVAASRVAVAGDWTAERVAVMGDWYGQQGRAMMGVLGGGGWGRWGWAHPSWMRLMGVCNGLGGGATCVASARVWLAAAAWYRRTARACRARRYDRSAVCVFGLRGGNRRGAVHAGQAADWMVQRVKVGGMTWSKMGLQDPDEGRRAAALSHATRIGLHRVQRWQMRRQALRCPPPAWLLPRRRGGGQCQW